MVPLLLFSKIAMASVTFPEYIFYCDYYLHKKQDEEIAAAHPRHPKLDHGTIICTEWWYLHKLRIGSCHRNLTCIQGNIITEVVT